MNAYETRARYNIAETCVDSVSLEELFRLTNTDDTAFWQNFRKKRLTYGDIEGTPEFRQGVCGLYRTLKTENIVPTHGAAGANHHVFYSLIEPGDEVISIMPTYQQLYSIPESLGAKVKILNLTAENGYHVELQALKELVTEHTRMICINNPNNPTGAQMTEEELTGIVKIISNFEAVG